jgi:hypothetical protein
MIVGPNFVWVHFPKCAGHAVEAALRVGARGRRDIVFDARRPHHPGWHDSVAERVQRDETFSPSNKLIIAGFRRLPHWMLSRVHFEVARPPHRAATREMICRGEFFQQNGVPAKADDHAQHYTSPKVHRWIRSEHLAEDFAHCFSDILGDRTTKAVRRLRKVVNPTELNYVKAVDFHFTARDLDTLYEANPVWARLEREVYGDLLSV